jgi:hypothetical protein
VRSRSRTTRHSSRCSRRRSTREGYLVRGTSMSLHCVRAADPVLQGIAQRRYRRSRNGLPDRRIARLSPWRPGAAQRSRSVTCTTPRSCFVPRESPLF